jgi:hypothetical protein
MATACTTLLREFQAHARVHVPAASMI